MRTAIPAHCTQRVMDTRMVATPACRAKTMEVSFVFGSRHETLRLTQQSLRSGRRPFAVHPQFEISSKNAQARPAPIKASHLARLARASGTYERGRVLRNFV